MDGFPVFGNPPVLGLLCIKLDYGLSSENAEVSPFDNRISLLFSSCYHECSVEYYGVILCAKPNLAASCESGLMYRTRCSLGSPECVAKSERTLYHASLIGIFLLAPCTRYFRYHVN